MDVFGKEVGYAGRGAPVSQPVQSLLRAPLRENLSACVRESA